MIRTARPSLAAVPLADLSFHQPPIGAEMPVDMVAEVPLTGLSFGVSGASTHAERNFLGRKTKNAA
jgi:hypothetical protein